MTASLVVIRRFVIGLMAVIGLAGLYVGQNTQALGLGGIVPAVDAATTTGLVASPNPAFSGQAVTFTAIVTSTFEITPTGVVTFTDGATPLGVGLCRTGRPASTLQHSALAGTGSGLWVNTVQSE